MPDPPWSSVGGGKAYLREQAIVVQDSDGEDQVTIGKLGSGYGIDVEDGAITVGGGTVRAIDHEFGIDTYVDSDPPASPTQIMNYTHTPPDWATSAIITITNRSSAENQAAIDFYTGASVVVGSGEFSIANARISLSGAGYQSAFSQWIMELPAATNSALGIAEPDFTVFGAFEVRAYWSYQSGALSGLRGFGMDLMTQVVWLR